MNYGRFVSLAKRLIGDKGATVTVTRGGGSEEWQRFYDPETMRYMWQNLDDPGSEAVSEKPDDTDLVFSGVAVQTDWSTYAMAAGVVKAGDVKLITQTDQPIKPGDLIGMGGREYVAADPIKDVSPDAGTLIIQEVNCRGIR